MILVIREESAGVGQLVSYLIPTMDSIIEAIANRLRIRGDAFHPCNRQFQSFASQPCPEFYEGFDRYAPFNALTAVQSSRKSSK